MTLDNNKQSVLSAKSAEGEAKQSLIYAKHFLVDII